MVDLSTCDSDAFCDKEVGVPTNSGRVTREPASVDWMMSSSSEMTSSSSVVGSVAWVNVVKVSAGVGGGVDVYIRDFGAFVDFPRVNFFFFRFEVNYHICNFN